MYYLCHRKEERALDTRVLSSFFVKNQTYKGGFTSDVEKNRSEIIFFLGVIVCFLGQVVAIVADVERLEVKIYLFSWGADLTFQGSSQVVARCGTFLFSAICNSKSLKLICRTYLYRIYLKTTLLNIDQRTMIQK